MRDRRARASALISARICEDVQTIGGELAVAGGGAALFIDTLHRPVITRPRVERVDPRRVVIDH